MIQAKVQQCNTFLLNPTSQFSTGIKRRHPRSHGHINPSKEEQRLINMSYACFAPDAQAFESFSILAPTTCQGVHASRHLGHLDLRKAID